MKAEQFHEIEELFHEARSLDPSDRASFLDDACGSALDVREEVESLLAHSDRGTSAVYLGTDDDTPEITIVDRGPVKEGPGTWIGPYKILQKIGEGGFGVVYMAEQNKPVQRRVAVKIIKLGMDTKQVIARFEAERQALAMMDHPNIARVLEAGATETGRPYFVMELVKGIPINEYCDQGKLSTRQRLELFMDVCRAVQHAHQKGVIHRDLKPSNVLVTLHDTKPVPKVIDFGIAKATSHRLTEKTLFTEFRYFIGTPEYMSPDQAEICGLDVDTRTDIYSLGVLLYELLTGTPPFDPETLRSSGYGEIQRIIREVEPPKPSTRLVTLARDGSTVGKYRRAEPGPLSKLMKGDLDWIVMKAMEKDRTRRYQSASEFTADLERFLHGQPVMAGPPSVGYKFRKFVQRHRVSVAAAVVIVAALVVGFSAATVGFVQARQEARRSQQIADFLQDLFVSTNPDQAVAEGADVQSVLTTSRQVFGDDHATVAATLSSRALQLQSGGDLEGAEELYRESLEIWSDQFGDDNVNVGTTLSRLGLLLITKGDNEAAEVVLRQAILITETLPGAETVTACEPMATLASVLANRGEFDEAASLMRGAVDIRRTHAPHQKIQIAITVNALGNILLMSSKDEELTALIPEILEAWRDAVPADSVFLARVLTDIGMYYVSRKMPDDAEPLLREALAIHKDAAGDGPVTQQQALTVRLLYGILEDRDDPVEAIPIAIEAVETAREFNEGRHYEQAVKDLANVAWRVARDPGLTEQDYLVGLEAVEMALAEKPENAAYINSLGVLKYRLGEYGNALETFALSHAYYSQQYEVGVPADLAFMALCHYELGHREQAQEFVDLLRIAMQDPGLPKAEDNIAHIQEVEAVFGALE
jgi:serine/threonine protein kinase